MSQLGIISCISGMFLDIWAVTCFFFLSFFFSFFLPPQLNWAMLWLILHPYQ